MFLGDLFDVGVESASITNCTSFVRSLVNIANSNGGGEFFSRESVFSDKLPVNARDVGTGVHQCGGANNFKGMRGCDQLY